jgi:CMP-N,N'-diacetyllegionaminic acid synthase
MKEGKLSAVVAVRKGSQRIPNKNIKPFGDTNLLELKLKNLKQVFNIDEIIVNSDCDKMLDIGLTYGCTIIKRDPYFASSEANNSEFHHHIAETTDTDFIFLAPVCSPFISTDTHIKAINMFKETTYDSLTSVDVIQNHLWLNGKPINYDINNVPNSQDLPKILRLNYGISIISRKSMLERRGVVGNNPGFYPLEGFESIDVDTPMDFNTSELIYTNYFK